MVEYWPQVNEIPGLRHNENPNKLYHQTLLSIEAYGHLSQIHHRFVGGTITDLLGPDTNTTIDFETRTIILENHHSPSLHRPDGTVKDIDLICFSPDKDEIDKFRAFYKQERRRIGADNYPYVSLEETFYPGWPNRTRLLQLVTTWDVNNRGVLSLNFGNRIHQPIPWESIAPWTLQLEDETQLTTLHPFALTLCYLFRCASGLKKKDVEDRKLYPLMNLASQVINLGGANHVNLYASWIRYINNLHINPDTLTKIKAMITQLYWNSFGTTLSHGRGPFRHLSTFSDRFTG